MAITKKTARKKPATKKKTTRRRATKKTVVREVPKSVTFHYIKSAAFRTIHVDGAIGGVTPRGGIHMSVFSERLAIPQIVVQEMNPDGALGAEDSKKRVAKEGIVRDMEADLFFDLAAAKSIRNWLELRINELEALQAPTPGPAKTTTR